jgi:hypothetical protein
MNIEAKEVISCRVSSETKQAIEERSKELGFRSHSAFLECVLQLELEDSRVQDEKLEEVIDLMFEKVVPKAASKFLKKYSTENLTRDDLKDAMYEFVKERIKEENLDLRWWVRKRLK